MYLISKRRMWGLISAGVFLLTGCGLHPAKYLTMGEERASQRLQAQVDEGNRLFFEGSYKDAETVFQSLQQSGSTVVMRQALYGLACTRFMLAKNKQEYLDAVKILERWRQMAPASFEEEDPRMLIALFPGVLSGHPEEDQSGTVSAEGGSLMRILNYEKEISDLESEISSQQKKIEALEKQTGSMKAMQESMKKMQDTIKAKEDATKAMEEELVKLRSQIKTFESIDQEIQEKKQGISPQ